MSWELIKTETQGSNASTLTCNFDDVAFADVAFFVIVMNGKAGDDGSGSNFRIGPNSGVSVYAGYDMESFVMSGGSSPVIDYTDAVNQTRFPFMAMSENDSYTSAIIYLGLDFARGGSSTEGKPLCFWKVATQETVVEGSGWLDVNLTNFGEVKWEAEVGDIDADSYISVYKVASS